MGGVVYRNILMSLFDCVCHAIYIQECCAWMGVCLYICPHLQYWEMILGHGHQSDRK